MINVGIIGHTGRLGKHLVGILNNHPYAKIVYTESRKEGGNGDLSDAELIFLALPYGESKNYLPKLKGKKLIDLSIDHRDNEEWIYGLPELNKYKIKNADKIANPGCYATSIILGLAPLKGKISDVCISSVSGISGTGMEVQEKDNFLVYEEGRMHSQIKEIEKMLELEEILFIPQRIDNAYRGIVSNIFTKCDFDGDLISLYTKFYEENQFIRIKEKENIETKNVNETNFCDVKIVFNSEHPKNQKGFFDIKILKSNYNIAIVSALDNLIKGGAGQAVQNMNIMHGFDETAGLLDTLSF